MIGDIKIFQIIRYMINTHYGLDKSSQQYPDLNIILYNWPAHPDDPQGIRVASVIEFSVCLWICVFWANFLISSRSHVIVVHVTIEFAAG